MGVLESGVSHWGWLITHLLVLYYCSKPCFCKFGTFKCSHAQVSQGLDVGLPVSYPMCLNAGSHCTVYIFHLTQPSLDLLILHLPFRVSVWHLSDFVSSENSLHVSRYRDLTSRLDRMGETHVPNCAWDRTPQIPIHSLTPILGSCVS